MTVVLFFMTSLIYLAESVNSYTRVTVVITLINDKPSKFNTWLCRAQGKSWVFKNCQRGAFRVRLRLCDFVIKESTLEDHVTEARDMQGLF